MGASESAAPREPANPHPDLLASMYRATVGVIVVGIDLEGTITAFNVGAESMLGYTAAEMVGRATPMVFHDEAELQARARGLGVATWLEVIAREADGAEPSLWTYVRKDGSRFPATLILTTVTDASGVVTGYLGIAQDRTPDMRTEADRERVALDLRVMFHNSPVPTVITGITDARVRLANRAAADVIGEQPEALVGRTTAEIGFWEDLQARARALETLERDGRVTDLEIQVNRDERTRHFVASLVPLDFEGEHCLIGTFVDITPRKQAEQSLSESEERFRQLAENIDIAFFLRQVEPYRLLYASPAAERLLGVPQAEFHTDPSLPWRLLHPDDLPGIQALSARAAHEATEAEARAVRPDGTVRTMRLRSFPVRDPDGRVTRIAATVEDVTAQREAAQALRDSEERFRQLTETIDEGFLLRTAAPVRYLYVSPGAERIFGVTAEETTRDPYALARLAHPDDRARVEARMAETDPSAGLDLAYRITRPDGEQRWIRAYGAPVDVPPGEQPRLAVSVRDVTEQVHAEQALERARAEADRANLAKSEFLSRMSHELRTPLNAVIGFGQLLQMDDLDAGQRESVGHILLGGRHLLELIDEVLDISRIETGRLKVSLEPVSLADVVEETVALVRPLADTHEVRLRTRGSVTDVVHVVADRQRMAQVMINLLTNAVKYNRTGGEVEIWTEAAAENRMRLLVRDTGVGIPEDRLADLFTPFDRLGAEETGVEGTGLGMALTQRLVEVMHGTVAVDSTVGVGTTVTVDLERSDVSDVVDMTSVRAVSARPHSTGSRVLYVEDNQTNVRLLQRVLEDRPHVSLLVARDGRSALGMASRRPPDLVLLDVDLPDLDGMDVLVRLHAHPATRHLPVVAVSADASPGLRRRMLASGAVAYLTKPYDVTELLRVMDEHLAGNRQTASPGRPDR